VPDSREFRLPAGVLRHRIQIQSESNARDANGGVIKSWNTVATRWGKIRPLSGRELIAAEQVDSRVTHEITIRYYPGLTSLFRLVHDSRVFNISSPPRDIDERKKVMILQATEDTSP